MVEQGKLSIIQSAVALWPLWLPPDLVLNEVVRAVSPISPITQAHGDSV